MEIIFLLLRMWYWTNIKNNVSKNLEEKVIVFFYKYGELLVHRIVKISVDMISCKKAGYSKEKLILTETYIEYYYKYINRD